MATINLSLIQDKPVNYTIRQGVKFSIEIEWLDADAQPLDISDMTFLSQIRTNYAENNGSLIVDFDTTPNERGDYYEIDEENARLIFYVDETTVASWKTKQTYYFESKMLNADDEAIDSFQATITVKPDVARAV